MNGEPTTVYVVVDRDFGEGLASLPVGVPVWIVDSPANNVAATRLWKERPASDHLTGITTHKHARDTSPEDNLSDELEMIDLHHGPYSHTPPYTRIQVLGTPLSDGIRRALAEFGFDQFASTPNGFVASRPVPTTPI